MKRRNEGRERRNDGGRGMNSAKDPSMTLMSKI